MSIPSFRMPAIKQVWQLNQQGDYAFFIDQKDAYLNVPIVKHHHHFLEFGRIHLIIGRFFPLGLLKPLGFSFPLLNPYCSFAVSGVSTLLFIWMIS